MTLNLKSFFYVATFALTLISCQTKTPIKTDSDLDRYTHLKVAIAKADPADMEQRQQVIAEFKSYLQRDAHSLLAVLLESDLLHQLTEAKFVEVYPSYSSHYAHLRKKMIASRDRLTSNPNKQAAHFHDVILPKQYKSELRAIAQKLNL